MMLRPLDVFGWNISNGNEFFNLYAIRLNKREATRRKKKKEISVAGEFHTRANSDLYEIALDDGAVKINGTSTGDRLIVFEHRQQWLSRYQAWVSVHFHAYWFRYF